MAAPSDGSAAVRRLGRAGPTASEMDLLRAAVLDGGRAEAAWRRWAATHPIDDTARYPVELLPAVSSNLAADVIGDDAGRLRGLRRRAWADNQARSTAVCAAVEAIGSMGPTLRVPIVTGGAALATTVFSDAATRSWGPVDLVFGDTSPDTDVVAEALRPAGWSRVRDVAGPFDEVVDMVDRGGRLIRLRRWVLFPGLAGVPERQWEQRAVGHDLGSCAVRRFRMSDELVAAVLTGLLVDASARSRWPLDVVQLCRHAPSVDRIGADEFWREVVASAAEVGAGPVVADALEMCRVELDAPVPADVVDELAAGPFDQHLRRRWALRRRGITPAWRVLRYRRSCRERGARPTALGYVAARYAALAARGVGPSVRDRVDRATRLLSDRRGSRAMTGGRGARVRGTWRAGERASERTPAHLPDPGQQLLVRAAVAGGDVGLEAWRTWLDEGGADDGRFDIGSERLLPLVYSSVARNNDDVPRREMLAAAYRRSWYVHHRLFHGAKPAILALQDAGHAVLVVKGASLAARYYEDRGARTISDIDVVVRDDEAAAALDVLVRSGWRCSDPAFSAEEMLARSHAVGLVDDHGDQLDLHRRMLYLSRPGLDGPVWDRAVPTTIDNVTVLTPCAADELLLTLVHGWAWSAVSSIRWIPDVAAIVAHMQTDDWRTLIDEARRRQVSFRVWTALQYVHDHDDVAVPAAVLDELAAGPFASFEASEERWHTTAHGRVPPGVFAYYEYARRVGTPNGLRWWMHFARYYASLVGRSEGDNPVDWLRVKVKRRRSRKSLS